MQKFLIKVFRQVDFNGDLAKKPLQAPGLKPKTFRLASTWQGITFHTRI